MSEENTLLLDVMEEKLENLKTQEAGSKEQHSATEDVKLLSDIYNESWRLMIEDADKTERREHDFELKKKELELRERELNLEHEHWFKEQIRKDEEMNLRRSELEESKKSSFWNTIINGGKVVAMVALAVVGYNFEYKQSGIETGNTFKNVKNKFFK